MSRKAEIGSNFWISQAELDNLGPVAGSIEGLDKWDHCQPVSSGRGAIKLLFRNLPQVRRVLLPVYTCSSVINPIESLGIQCFFYAVGRDFTVDADELLKRAEETNPDAIYFQTYYGFDTLSGIRDAYQYFQDKGVIIVEDVTHSWLSDSDSTKADYCVVSLRKWLQIPDGGALMSSRHPLGFEMTREDSKDIVAEFLDASVAKERYFKTFNPGDKELFRSHYFKAKDLLQADDEPYLLSRVSNSVLTHMDFDAVKKRRRENALYLHQHIRNPHVEACCRFEVDHSTPLYYPVYVRGERGRLQKELAQQNIYCPVHWPVPEQVKQTLDDDAMYIYSHVLSLVCDQRYDLDDMEAIVETINLFSI